MLRLTTALLALRSGYVVVGSLPTTDGRSDTAAAGCLLILDWNGNVVQTVTGHHINGPWDRTAVDGDDFASCLAALNSVIANPLSAPHNR